MPVGQVASVLDPDRSLFQGRHFSTCYTPDLGRNTKVRQQDSIIIHHSFCFFRRHGAIVVVIVVGVDAFFLLGKGKMPSIMLLFWQFLTILSGCESDL